jgi:hypothetical protein
MHSNLQGKINVHRELSYCQISLDASLFLRYSCVSTATSMTDLHSRRCSLNLITHSHIHNKTIDKTNIPYTGPTPLIEKSVNTSRSQSGNQPIPFRLSDSHPNLDAWMPLATHSANLSFIPQPVDATDTSHAPPLVVSKTSSSPNSSGDHKSIHLYNLSFHHFDDQDAAKIMKSTLATADGVCILELQDRSAGMLMLMLGNLFCFS